jgi:hypothetical protein
LSSHEKGREERDEEWNRNKTKQKNIIQNEKAV